jgi:hypothetical protein
VVPLMIGSALSVIALACHVAQENAGYRGSNYFLCCWDVASLSRDDEASSLQGGIRGDRLST